MYERIGKYLQVERIANPGRKTRRWLVLGNDGDSFAEIAWYGPWRQYTFDPMLAASFNAGCLRDVATFLETENRAQRARQSKPAALADKGGE